jgi:hypothetical protein
MLLVPDPTRVVVKAVTAKMRGRWLVVKVTYPGGRDVVLRFARAPETIPTRYGAKPSDITGQRFGRLVADQQVGLSSSGTPLWLCRCDCGTSKIVTVSNLRSGSTVSCSCHRRDVLTTVHTTHGLSNNKLFRNFLSMVTRCTNPKSSHWHRYGGRGIRVCDEWLNDPAAFVRWGMENGYAPGLQIDRIDNDGNYEPGNCRFVTPKVNVNNRSHPSTWKKPARRKRA